MSLGVWVDTVSDIMRWEKIPNGKRHKSNPQPHARWPLDQWGDLNVKLNNGIQSHVYRTSLIPLFFDHYFRNCVKMSFVKHLTRLEDRYTWHLDLDSSPPPRCLALTPPCSINEVTAFTGLYYIDFWILLWNIQTVLCPHFPFITLWNEFFVFYNFSGVIYIRKSQNVCVTPFITQERLYLC